MRFTATEETGNPYPDISSFLIEGFKIIIEESSEVLFQFTGNNVFIKFLNQHVLGILIYLYYAINLTVNVLLKHLLNFHNSLSLLNNIKRTVVRIGIKLIKKFYISSIKGAGIHYENRYI